MYRCLELVYYEMWKLIVTPQKKHNNMTTMFYVNNFPVPNIGLNFTFNGFVVAVTEYNDRDA
jgi:hypothetical protein